MSEQAAPSSSGGSSGAAPIVQRCFAETTLDATIYYQIMDIGKQLFIWVSSGSAKLANLQLAIQSHTDRMPALATLLPGAASEESTSLAQRLALRTHRPVLCSVNLPKGSPMLQAIAEKRLFQEIKDMGLCAPAASSSSDGIAPVAASTHTATATDGAPPAQS